MVCIRNFEDGYWACFRYLKDQPVHFCGMDWEHTWIFHRGDSKRSDFSVAYDTHRDMYISGGKLHIISYRVTFKNDIQNMPLLRRTLSSISWGKVLCHVCSAQGHGSFQHWGGWTDFVDKSATIWCFFHNCTTTEDGMGSFIDLMSSGCLFNYVLALTVTCQCFCTRSLIQFLRR